MHPALLMLSCQFLVVASKPHKPARQLPEFVPVCHRDDPELENCIIKAVYVLQPKLSKGIPEMLIPALDPMRLPEVTIKENAFSAQFNDLEIENLVKNNLTKVHFDLDKNELSLRQAMPLLRIRSNYEINGKLLFMQLKGGGKFEGNFSDIMSDVHLYGTRLEKRGKEYFNFNKVSVKLTVGKAKVRLQGLFPDSKLTDTTNQIINENILDFMDELMPLVQASVEDLVVKLLSNFFASFSIDVLLPP